MVTAVAFIAAKPVLEYLDPLSFSISQFGLASLFSLAWLLFTRQIGDLKRVTPGQWTFMVVVSMLFLSAVYTMWIGLSRIPATAASLLNRLEILVVVFLGMALLGDRLRRRETYGAVVMFLGVVVLRYQAPESFSAGFWMMILSSLLFGVTEVLIKTRVHAIPPDTFVFARNFLAFLMFMIGALWRVAMEEGVWWKGLADWDGIQRGLPLITTTALVGPFLARTLYMHCLRNLDISRAALINQSQPLFVAIYSAILLHTLPSRREWTGGLLIVAGALLLVSWRRGLVWFKKRRR
jgi:drug/metabolite transporter (DMT)-like permease